MDWTKIFVSVTNSRLDAIALLKPQSRLRSNRTEQCVHTVDDYYLNKRNNRFNRELGGDCNVEFWWKRLVDEGLTERSKS